MKNPKRMLRNLRLSRVDLVPAGANPHSFITLTKEDATIRKVTDALAADIEAEPTVTELTDDSVTYTVDDGTYARGWALAADGSVTLSEPTAVDETSDEEPQVTDPNTDALEQARQEAAEAAKAEAQAEIDKARADAEAEIAELRKQLDADTDAEVRKELDEAKAELAKTNEALAEVRKEQRRRDFVAKARQFDGFGDTDKVAGLLMAADEHLSDEHNAQLESLLRAASKQINESDLFKQFAHEGAEPAESAQEKLERLARERVEKDSSLTAEQAQAAVMAENPELRAEVYKSVRS